MALLAMTLIVGVIFYVYNVGDHLNRRLVLQSAADSATISGADWMARSMNAVAMNNCAQSRMLALVPIFDAAPLASEMAFKESAAWEKGLAAQLKRNIPRTKNDFLRSGLTELHARIKRDRDMLEGLSEAINLPHFDMRTTTHWAVPDMGGDLPHGSMWQTAVALGEFSEVVVESAGVLAQGEAGRFGRANRANISFMLPLLPEIPAKEGTFADFRPVLTGTMTRGVEYQVVGDRLLTGDQYVSVTVPTGSGWLGRGGGIPDAELHHRLGPWAKLYKWRHYKDISYGGERVWTPGRAGTPSTSNPPKVRGKTKGGSPLGGGAGRRGSSQGTVGTGSTGSWKWVGRKYARVGYQTCGPYRQAIHLVACGMSGDLWDSMFASYLSDISHQKLRYMFHHLDSGEPVELAEYYYPEWVHTDNYPNARMVSPAKIRRTNFYVLEIISSRPEGSPGWLTPGTYRTNSPHHLGTEFVPIRHTVSRWMDPGTWGIQQVANYIWSEHYTYEITYFPEIGIDPKPGPNGELAYQPVYVRAYYIWGGIDIGEEVEIRNPCNWETPEGLPRPLLYEPGDEDEYDYDPEDPDHDQNARRRWFTFLGMTENDTKTKVWPSRFRHKNPLGAMATVAQVKLFNHSSWDLWTQDWQVQLTPVSQWDEWMDFMDDQQDDVEATEGVVTPNEYDRLKEYFQSIDDDMAEIYFNH
jgi:hypothetical protein